MVKDILIITPPVNFNVPSDYVPDHPITGPLILASLARQKGYSVSLIDNRDRHLTLAQLLGEIKKSEIQILAISAFTSNIRGAVQLAKAVKEKFVSRVVIMLGGPHVSADPDIIKRYPFFDIGVVREADITFPKLLDETLAKKKKVRGIFVGEAPQDLDTIPFPARDLVDWSQYKQFRTNNIMAARGCPFNCVFCSIPSIERKTRYRSVGKVVEEMREAIKITKSNLFTFIDDTLTVNRIYMIKLCEAILASGLKVEWEGHTRANLIDDELLKIMSKAGCYELSFGVESGNEKIRNKVIQKKVTNEEIRKAVKLCYKNNILPDFYLMLGFPEEGKKEVEDTVNFGLKLNPPPNTIGIHLTIPLPGAPIYEKAIEEGVIPEDVIDRYIKGEYGEHFNECWPVYVNDKVDIHYLKEAQARGYKKFYWRPRYLLQRLLIDWKTPWRLKQDVQKGWELLKMRRARYAE